MQVSPSSISLKNGQEEQEVLSHPIEASKVACSIKSMVLMKSELRWMEMFSSITVFPFLEVVRGSD